MNRIAGVIAAAGSAVLLTSVASAGTLDNVRAKGFFQCGINTGLAGFSFTDDAGEWDGFDAAFCRAELTPYSSALIITFKVQRIRSAHSSSPWRTSGPSGSFEMISG